MNANRLLLIQSQYRLHCCGRSYKKNKKKKTSLTIEVRFVWAVQYNIMMMIMIVTINESSPSIDQLPLNKLNKTTGGRECT